MIIEVNDKNVESVIAKGLVLLDVWAPWCGPCKSMHPILEEVSSEMGNNVTIARINADTDIGFAHKLGVKGIPAFFIYKNGLMVNNWVGSKNKNDIRKLLESYL